MLLKNVYNYIRHSALAITIIFNPFHWRYIPDFYYNDRTDWPYDGVQIVGSWLFIKIQVLVSDGSW